MYSFLLDTTNFWFYLLMACIEVVVKLRVVDEMVENCEVLFHSSSSKCYVGNIMYFECTIVDIEDAFMKPFCCPTKYCFSI